MDALITALRRLPELTEVEAAELFNIERMAFSIQEKSGYPKTVLFLVAVVFDRLARKLEGEEPQPGTAYSAISAKAVEALSVGNWDDGTRALDELVDIAWASRLLH